MLRKLKTKERCKKITMFVHLDLARSKDLLFWQLCCSLDTFHFVFNISPVCVFCFTISSSLKHAALTKFEKVLQMENFEGNFGSIPKLRQATCDED